MALLQCSFRDKSVIYCDGLCAGKSVSNPSQQDISILHCFQTKAETKTVLQGMDTEYYVVGFEAAYGSQPTFTEI
jgi:hypothetical protein